MIRILTGDCAEVMKTLPAESVDAIVTDPPYGLEFMGKAWDGAVPGVEVWRQCLRVLKPGGHLLAFAGTRTQHRMACAIEDAGFEIRDLIAWLYGSGFPKSLDVSKAIDKAAGAVREVIGVSSITGARGGSSMDDGHKGTTRTYQNDEQRINYATAASTDAARQWSGWGTALKPAMEPITVARKPLVGTVAANVLAHGTGALNIDGCRVGADGGTRKSVVAAGPSSPVDFGEINTAAPGDLVPGLGRWPANVILSYPEDSYQLRDDVTPAGARMRIDEKKFVALPAHLQAMFRKLPNPGSDEVVAGFPETTTTARGPNCGQGGGSKTGNGIYSELPQRGYRSGTTHGDTGSAARFFYTAKASSEDRNNGHAIQRLMTWENVDLRPVAEALLRLQRVTSDAMTLLQDERAWSTSSFGKRQTDRCRSAIKSIIETSARLTTGSITSNLSPPSNTNGFIRAVIEAATVNGSSLADCAACLSQLKLSSTDESTESVLDVVLAALQMLCDASKSAKLGNTHSTVKPTDLMRYLVRLVTPPGGTVLDPFAGSGSTLLAADREQFHAIGIELDPEYAELTRRRLIGDSPLFAEVS